MEKQGLSSYYLMNKNTPLLSFCLDQNYGTEDIKLKISSILSSTKDLLPFELRDDLENNLLYWIRRRTSPIGQKLLDIINEESQTSDSPLFLAETTLLLSLNDAFWIKPVASNFLWEKVNLYHNTFNQTLSEIVFSANKFSSSIKEALKFGYRSPEFTSKGTLKKCWGRREDSLFLLKEDTLNKNYNQSHAEWFAQQVASHLGLPHIVYDLELYLHKNEEPRLVSSCEIFTNDNAGYIEASRAFDIDSLFEKSGQMRMAKNMGWNFYSNMMFFDTLIGNTDRHSDNFGCLFDTNTGKIISPAPLFDNGRSLFSTEDTSKKINFDDWRYEHRGYFMTFKNQIAWFLNEKHNEMLESMSNFEFKQHPIYVIPDSIFNLLNEFIADQVNFVKQNLDKKICIKGANTYINLDNKIVSFINEQFLKYDSFLKIALTDENACVKICSKTICKIKSSTDKEPNVSEILNIARCVLALFNEKNCNDNFSYYSVAYNAACEECSEDTIKMIEDLALKHGCKMEDLQKP